jgi:hypothetical protein
VNTTRNPLLLRAKLFQTIFTALFVGGVYFDLRSKGPYTDNQIFLALGGLMLFLSISALIMSAGPVAITFPI